MAKRSRDAAAVWLAQQRTAARRQLVRETLAAQADVYAARGDVLGRLTRTVRSLEARERELHPTRVRKIRF